MKRIARPLSRFLALGVSLFLVGCGSGNDTRETAVATYDVAEEPPAPEAAQAPGIVGPPQAGSASQASAPQIAYTYSYGYRVDGSRVAELQRRHVALCDSLGLTRCRIIALVRDNSEGAFAHASLSLLIDAGIARSFGERLDAAASAAGGETSKRGIEAEDLSKQIVDTEARLRGKEALAGRLLVLLQNRGGKVGELVEAERAYAQAQEELDAARSWLAEMRQRVAMSRVEISYASDTPEGGGLWHPVRESFASAGQKLGNSLAAMLTFVFVALPWLALLAALVWLARHFRPRGSGRTWFRRRKQTDTSQEP